MPSEFINNENRARLRDSINKPTPRSADGPIAGGARIDPSNSVPGNEMPPGILSPNSTPMMLDSHAGARRSNDNIRVKEGEVSRSARMTEVRRRIYSRNPDYKY
jgi:hypothetical protein